MTNRTDELRQIIADYYPRFQGISSEDYKARPLPHKWSKKEILGHLIDSAQNNIQRFIRGQYEDNPYLMYGQDDWVSLNNYQKKDETELIELWKLLNLQITHIWDAMPEENLSLPCRVAGDQVTIQWHVDDYTEHLKHHLKQIFG